MCVYGLICVMPTSRLCEWSASLFSTHISEEERERERERERESERQRERERDRERDQSRTCLEHPTYLRDSLCVAFRCSRRSCVHQRDHGK